MPVARAELGQRDILPVAHQSKSRRGRRAWRHAREIAPGLDPRTLRQGERAGVKERTTAGLAPVERIANLRSGGGTTQRDANRSGKQAAVRSNYRCADG